MKQNIKNTSICKAILTKKTKKKKTKQNWWLEEISSTTKAIKKDPYGVR